MCTLGVVVLWSFIDKAWTVMLYLPINSIRMSCNVCSLINSCCNPLFIYYQLCWIFWLFFTHLKNISPTFSTFFSDVNSHFTANRELYRLADTLLIPKWEIELDRANLFQGSLAATLLEVDGEEFWIVFQSLHSLHGLKIQFKPVLQARPRYDPAPLRGNGMESKREDKAENYNVDPYSHLQAGECRVTVPGYKIDTWPLRTSSTRTFV